MRPLLPLARFGLAAAVAGLTSLTFAAPAHARAAEPPHTWVGVDVPYLVNVPENATSPKPLKVKIYNQTSLAARNVSVKIDISRLSPRFTAVLPGSDQGCTSAGPVATCSLAALAGDATHAYTMGVGLGDPAAEESEGKISVTASAENTPGDDSGETIVQLTPPGIDLVIAEIDDLKLAPGASATVPIALRNEGTVAADGFAVLLSTTAYLELPNPYRNCSYNPDYLELTCFFEGSIPEGAVMVIDSSTPLRLKVADRTPGPYTYGAWATVIPLTDEAAAERRAAARKADGKELKLVPATAKTAREFGEDLNFDDNVTEFGVQVPLQRADSIAVGGTVSGSIGDTRTVKVGIRNDGPANTLGPDDTWASSAEITLPEGVTPLKVAEQCVPVTGEADAWKLRGKAKGLVYHCWPWEHVAAGSTYQFQFTVKISGEPGTAGSIVVDGGVQDPDTANNTAAITLDTGGSGAGLPVTGARAGALAAGGALALTAGVIGVILARRRRIVTVA